MDYTIVGGAVNIASRLEESAAPGEILVSYETFAQVNDRIRCEERGEIEVKGIAYPLATYRVIDSYEELGRERRRFSERHAHLRLDLDLDAMTARDRAQASGLLRKALGLLDGDNGPARAPSEPRDSAKRDAAAASKPGPTSDPHKPN
jgi:hypothetical protein